MRRGSSGRIGGRVAGLWAGLWLAVLMTFAAPAPARADVERLMQALMLDETIAQLRDEGLAYGARLADDMLTTGNDPGWQALSARIHDRQAMTRLLRDAFVADFGATDTAALIAFFEAPEGQALLRDELAARRIMMDPEAEATARAASASADPDSPRQRRITAFIEANDLLTQNVSGALNASFLFMQGMADGGALEMSEAEMLDHAWSQEEEVAIDTGAWIHAFLTLAYAQQDDDLLDRYIALSKTPEGQALNRALFAGFDALGAAQSYALGLAIASRIGIADL